MMTVMGYAQIGARRRRVVLLGQGIAAREEQRQQQYPTDDDWNELVGQLCCRSINGVVAVVRLKQQRLTLGRSHRRVHLKQVTPALFESILRATQIANLGFNSAFAQNLEFLRTKWIAGADQPGVVREDDRSVLGPDLDPGNVRTE